MSQMWNWEGAKWIGLWRDLAGNNKHFSTIDYRSPIILQCQITESLSDLWDHRDHRDHSQVMLFSFCIIRPSINYFSAVMNWCHFSFWCQAKFSWLVQVCDITGSRCLKRNTPGSYHSFLQLCYLLHEFIAALELTWMLPLTIWRTFGENITSGAVIIVLVISLRNSHNQHLCWGGPWATRDT